MSWYLHVVYLLSFVAMTMLMINICWTENNSNSFFNNLDYPNQSYRTAKEHHNTERMVISSCKENLSLILHTFSQRHVCWMLLAYKKTRRGK